MFACSILDVDARTLTIEATGTPDKIEALLELLARLRHRGARTHRADRARARRPRHPRARARPREGAGADDRPMDGGKVAH